MAKSSNLYIRIEPDVKEQAEKVFEGREFQCQMQWDFS